MSEYKGMSEYQNVEVLGCRSTKGCWSTKECRCIKTSKHKDVCPYKPAIDAINLSLNQSSNPFSTEFFYVSVYVST